MFGKKRDETVSQSAPTYIGGSMKIDGKIWGRRPIWIDGEVTGTINCESEVLIGPTARVKASSSENPSARDRVLEVMGNIPVALRVI